jgi:hypothetical protein
MRRATGSVLLALMFGLTFVACGSSDNHLSAAAQRQLQTLVGQVRRAAAAHDRAGAQQSLQALRRAVASDKKSGDIGADRAAHILADATRVTARLALVTTTSTIPVTVPTTRPPPPGHDKGPGKDHGNGDKHGGQNGND